MRLSQIAVFGLGVLVALVAIQTPALASISSTVPAPEIDGSSLSAGLGLLAAGLLIIRSRRKSK